MRAMFGIGECSGRKTPRCWTRRLPRTGSLVTCNVEDFLELARGREAHAGLVLIEQSGRRREQQLAIIRAAVAFIGNHDMANRVLWVNLDGTMEFEDIPPR